MKKMRQPTVRGGVIDLVLEMAPIRVCNANSYNIMNVIEITMLNHSLCGYLASLVLSDEKS